MVTEGDDRPVADDQVVTPVVSVASLIPEYGAAEGVKFDREENLCPDLSARFQQKIKVILSDSLILVLI
ncbi:hypothetical protein VBR00_04525, partial [Klebsiella pneumoniae]|nr:hypothetical protein [Klebsiella pneumoniae]